MFASCLPVGSATNTSKSQWLNWFSGIAKWTLQKIIRDHDANRLTKPDVACRAQHEHEYFIFLIIPLQSKSISLYNNIMQRNLVTHCKLLQMINARRVLPAVMKTKCDPKWRWTVIDVFSSDKFQFYPYANTNLKHTAGKLLFEHLCLNVTL